MSSNNIRTRENYSTLQLASVLRPHKISLPATLTALLYLVKEYLLGVNYNMLRDISIYKWLKPISFSISTTKLFQVPIQGLLFTVFFVHVCWYTVKVYSPPHLISQHPSWSLKRQVFSFWLSLWKSWCLYKLISSLTT